MVMRRSLEVIVVTPADAIAAEAGGADRLELIASFPEGGVTPSAGMIATICRATRLPVYVMIRPRGGSFTYTEAEVQAMVLDAQIAREMGATGLVVGAITPEGAIDLPTMQRILEAGRLPVTFHRAIEAVPDSLAALGQLTALPQVERVLTSGGTGRPLDSVDLLRAMCQRSTSIEVMVGAGVTMENVGAILRETGVQAIHVGTAVREPQAPTAPVSASRVERIRQILDGGR